MKERKVKGRKIILNFCNEVSCEEVLYKILKQYIGDKKRLESDMQQKEYNSLEVKEGDSDAKYEKC